MRRVGALAAVAVLTVAAATMWMVSARAASGSAVRPPVYDADAPDPSVVQVGAKYYAFTTQINVHGPMTNIPVYESTDLVKWTSDGDALPAVGSWASAGDTWAPSVVSVNTSWRLYYTAHDKASGRQCIGVADATTPAGPYTDSRSAPIVCQLDHAGSIDPSVFTDAAGTRWLIWKSDDNAVGAASIIWSSRLSADGHGLVGAKTALLAADRDWEAGLIEGPSAVALPTGGIALFYSARDWASEFYSVGYALCSGPAGPCAKQTTTGPWMSFANTSVAGPGGASTTTLANGTVVMPFAAWQGAVGYDNGGRRSLFIEPLDLSGAPRWRPDWKRTGGPLAITAPAVTSAGAQLDVFAAAGDGPLWHRRRSSGAWNDWEQLGGGLVGAPAVATGAAGGLDVAVHGVDNAVWHRAWNGSSWLPWETLRGGIVDRPAIAASAGGRLDVFVHGLDNAVWQRTFNGTAWSPWTSLGGGLIGGPGVTSGPGGTLDVFVQGVDHTVWHRTFNGTAWSAWTSLGGGLIGGPAAARSSDGTLAVFVQGLDHALWYRTLSGGTWSGWASLNGQIVSDPSATSTASGYVVAAGGTDGNAWIRSWNGSAWSPWVSFVPA